MPANNPALPAEDEYFVDSEGRTRKKKPEDEYYVDSEGRTRKKKPKKKVARLLVPVPEVQHASDFRDYK